MSFRKRVVVDAPLRTCDSSAWRTWQQSLVFFETSGKHGENQARGNILIHHGCSYCKSNTFFFTFSLIIKYYLRFFFSWNGSWTVTFLNVQVATRTTKRRCGNFSTILSESNDSYVSRRSRIEGLLRGGGTVVQCSSIHHFPFCFSMMRDLEVFSVTWCFWNQKDEMTIFFNFSFICFSFFIYFGIFLYFYVKCKIDIYTLKNLLFLLFPVLTMVCTPPPTGLGWSHLKESL